MMDVRPSQVSEYHWRSLSDADRALYRAVRPMPSDAYTVDVKLNQVERFLEQQQADLALVGGELELEPAFQRGHVWGEEQRSRYMEAMLRRHAPTEIRFNCAGWSSGSTTGGDLARHRLQCVDGLQRLTAMRLFAAGELVVFGGLRRRDLDGSPFDAKLYTFTVTVFEFIWEEELLQFYLDLNEGGTPHSAEELSRVRRMLEASRAARR